MHRLFSFIALAVVIATPCTGTAQGASGEEIPRAGTVAAVLGGLQVVRSSGASSLRVGNPVFVGDRLRTDAGARAKILLADDSVVDIGSATEVLIETQAIDPDTAASETVLMLNAGQIRVIASSETSEAMDRLEVETPAAVAFRGADFVVFYDVASASARIVSIEGSVSVAGKVGVVGGLVEVAPGTATSVAKGRLPRAPFAVDSDELVPIVQATTIVGTGRRDGLDVLHPVARGKLLAAEDVPATRGRRSAAGMQLGTPQESLADRLSADVRTNTEPLLEYERQRPGAPTVTGVEVEF